MVTAAVLDLTEIQLHQAGLINLRVQFSVIQPNHLCLFKKGERFFFFSNTNELQTKL